MKKIYIFFSFLILLCSPAYAKQSIQEEAKLFVLEQLKVIQDVLPIDEVMQYFNTLPVGTVATVNNVPITLEEIQNLADLATYSHDTELAFTIEEVINEYSFYLLKLIKQELIRQEIEKRALYVDYAQAEEIENIIKASYGYDFFDESSELSNNRDAWLQQIKRHLEQEVLQKEFLKNIHITSEEIFAFHQENPHLFDIKEKYILVMVSSFSEEDTQKALANKVETSEQALEYKVFIQEGTLPLENIPEEWQEEVKKLQEDSFSPLIHYENSFLYLVLKGKIPARTKTQTEAFLEIEKLLKEEKLTLVYDVWLEEALTKANIRIAPQLFKNPTKN